MVGEAVEIQRTNSFWGKKGKCNSSLNLVVLEGTSMGSGGEQIWKVLFFWPMF